MACITKCVMVPLTRADSTGKGLVLSCLSASLVHAVSSIGTGTCLFLQNVKKADSMTIVLPYNQDSLISLLLVLLKRSVILITTQNNVMERA